MTGLGARATVGRPGADFSRPGIVRTGLTTVSVLLVGLAAGLSAGSAAAAEAQAGPAATLETFGYGRVGYAIDRDGGRHDCYQLPGAASKYRLGNECDIYGEAGLRGRLQPGGGLRLRGDIRYAYFGSDEAPTEGDFSLAEAWLAVSGFLPAGQDAAQIWVGRRFYMRNDIHITDQFYWNPSGDGVGVEAVDLGFGQAAYAFFREEPQQVARLPATGDRRRVSRHDLRIQAIPANPGGSVTVGGDLRNYDGGGDDGTGGWQLAVQHEQKLGEGGRNVAAVQFGRGMARTLGGVSDGAAAPEARTARILDHITWRLDADWTAQAVALLEWRSGPGGDAVWGTLGARPVWSFSDTLAVAFEAGLDVVDPEAGGTRTLTKFTVAPMLTAGRDFFDRPQLRAYATYARWNGAARDAGLGSVGNGRDGLSFGVQVETWW